MEKIQKALAKAREQRTQSYAATAATAATAASEATAAGPMRQATRPDRPGERAAEQAKAARWEAFVPFSPDPKYLISQRVLTYSAIPEAGPFDILRTKMALTMRQHGWSRVAITSPDQGSGKTTIACNMALGFGRQPETTSMLFDMDLRRPGISRTLGLTPPHDIDKLLTGEVSPEEQMCRVRNNLAISASGRAVRDPAQLLGSPQTPHVLDSLQEWFTPDVMILDLTPMLSTDDARIVLKYVDCALIVARAEQTRISHLDDCEREVAQYTNVLGTVLNACQDGSGPDEYY
jgi:protein-tyrosine kinase